MKLLVIRHAIAEELQPGHEDARRSLTPKGRRQWQQAVKGLSRLGVTFDRLYHSPWLRAVETANALGPLVRGETTVTNLLARAPGRPLLDELRAAGADHTVGLVGHEPWLSELVSLLALGTTDRSDALLLKKGSVVWLEGEPTERGMQLRAFYPPRALRALGC
jgi:phosphohistidine phosphatase